MGERLDKLFQGEVDGVVIAKAALIRLGLNDLNELPLPGTTTPLQGQLGVVGSTLADEEADVVARAIVEAIRVTRAR